MEPFPYPRFSSPSYWLRDTELLNYRTTEKLPSSAHVVIIGGGITGIGVAFWLHNEGVKNVLLLEARGICSGATGRNGGIIFPRPMFSPNQYGHNFEYETVQLIKDTVAAHNIDCDLNFPGGLRGATSKEEEKLNTNVIGEVWDQQKIEQRLFNNSSSGGSSNNKPFFVSGIYTPTAGQIHPTKFVWGITKTLIQEGSTNIQTQTTVTRVTKLKDGNRRGGIDSSSGIGNSNSRGNSRGDSVSRPSIVVTTNRGVVVTQYLVYAMNAYTPGLLRFLSGIINPVKGQVIVSHPLEPTSATSASASAATTAGPDTTGITMNIIWNGGNEYMTFRPKEKIVVFGGFEETLPTHKHNYNDNQLDEEISHRISHFVQNQPFYKNLQIQQEWVGVQGFTKDGLPLVGPLEDDDGAAGTGTGTPGAGGNRVFIAAGYNGHGMPVAFGAAKMIAEAIAGKEVKWFPQLLPSRFRHIPPSPPATEQHTKAAL